MNELLEMVPCLIVVCLILVSVDILIRIAERIYK